MVKKNKIERIKLIKYQSKVFSAVKMLFSKLFELGLFIIGLLYVGDMYFDSCIELIRITHDIDEEEKDKQHDDELKQIAKHMYS